MPAKHLEAEVQEMSCMQRNERIVFLRQFLCLAGIKADISNPLRCRLITVRLKFE